MYGHGIIKGKGDKIMEQKRTNSSPLFMAAGLLFAVLALLSLYSFITSFGYYRHLGGAAGLFLALSRLTKLVGEAMACIFLLKQDMKKCGIGLIIVGVSWVLLLIYYIAFVHFSWQAYGYRYYSWYSDIRIPAVLGYLLACAAYVIGAVLASPKPQSKALYFIPAALFLLGSLFLNSFYSTFSIISFLIELAALVCAGLSFSALAGPSQPGQKYAGAYRQDAPPQRDIPEAAGSSSLPGEAYVSLFSHVLLLLFTFGIWYLVWIYKTTRRLNACRDEEPRDPTAKLLLCMFIPFYSIYWMYKSAQRVDRLAYDSGVPSDISTLCLILAIFIPIVPAILIQDKMNKIVAASAPQQPYSNAGARPRQDYSAPNQGTYARQSTDSATNQGAQARQPSGGAAPSGVKINEDAVTQLKAYKELMDMGIVTKDEFDAKKRELLGQ